MRGRRGRPERGAEVTHDRLSAGWFGFGSIILSAGALAAVACGAKDGTPQFVAALGASASVGFSAVSYGPEPANSWATGTNPAAHSIFLRLRERNGDEER